MSIGSHPVHGENARDGDERRIGGKAAGLARLLAAGARVPPFRVVEAAAFRAHLRSSGVLAALGETMLALGEVPADRRDDPSAFDALAAGLREAVEAAPVDPSLRDAIAAAVADLGPGPFAVRSSMVGEDSAEHSFAGQLDSRLFQPGVDDVVDSVRRCWGSAFSTHALMYAARAGLSPASVHVAVVVQAMVDADVAGVAFSANPISGARDECLVTAAYGLGEGVVADLAPADEYVWAPADGERSASVAAKDVQVVAAASGRGTERRPVPAELRDRRALSAEQVAAVGALTRSIADDAGRPMDVEWCFARGELYVLQARPITTLPPEPDPSAPEHLFDNSNIQESYNGVTTPLTFSFASRVYRIIYTSILRRIGASDASLEGFEPAARNLLALVDGRVYYNLEHWRHMLLLFPGGRRRVEEVETVMLHTTIGSGDPEPATPAERLRRGVELARMVARLTVYLARLDAEIERFVGRFQEVYDGVDRPGLQAMSLDELFARLRVVESRLLELSAPPQLNDLRVAMTSGRMRRLLAGVHPADEVDGRLADLLGGIEGLESVEPTRRLMAIARDARGDEALAAELRAADPAEVPAVIRRRAPALAERLDAYVERYGDRTIGELKLETPSLRDEPRFLGAVLRNYLDRPDLDPDRLLHDERTRFQAALRDLSARVPAWRRRTLAREVGWARDAVKARERVRLRRTWGFALARDIYRAIGARLQDAGVLHDARDVLWLSVDELDAFHEGRAVSARLAPLVAARKAEFAEYERHPYDDRFRTQGNPYVGARSAMASDDAARATSGEGDGALRGLGCCPGVVEAPVRIILDPRESLSLDGQVLCTIRTDPGWAPLFPTAGALIVERGSTLSHSAVVARELGIPTVVGVPGVTRILADGELVRVDGRAGTVERLEGT